MSVKRGKPSFSPGDIRAVFFDLDDTLRGTYSAKSMLHKYNARKVFGFELTDDEILQHWGKPVDELLVAVYGDDLDTAYAAVAENEHLFECKLIGNPDAVLRKLRSQKIVTGLVTSSSKRILDINRASGDELPDFALFDYVQTAEMTKVHKPDPRVFDSAKEFLHKKKVAPAQTLFVGDGIVDAIAARDAGMQFVGVTTGPKMTTEKFAAEGFAAIDSLVNLLEYLGLN